MQKLEKLHKTLSKGISELQHQFDCVPNAIASIEPRILALLCRRSRFSRLHKLWIAIHARWRHYGNALEWVSFGHSIGIWAVVFQPHGVRAELGLHFSVCLRVGEAAVVNFSGISIGHSEDVFVSETGENESENLTNLCWKTCMSRAPLGRLCVPDPNRSFTDWLSCAAPGPVSEKLRYCAFCCISKMT